LRHYLEHDSPLVTVVIPVKDRPNELLRSIDSVLQQTLGNFEIVVVENNSKFPRELENLVNALADKRIRFYSLENCQNANVARNFGCRVAQGEYISFLDSDDEYEPEHLARCVDLLQKSQTFFVYGSAKINNGISIRQVNARSLHEKETAFSYLFGGSINWAPTPTYVISRLVLEDVEWDEMLYRHQDFDFFIQVVSRYKSIANCNADVVINWPDGVKRNYDSMSMRFFYKKWSHLMSKKEKRRYCYGKIRVSVKMLDVKNIIIFSYSYFKTFLCS